MQDWVKMPSAWLRQKFSPPLVTLKWLGRTKSDQIAALMLYIVLVQHAQDRTVPGSRKLVGEAELTYTEMSDISGLSRSKVSGGLKVLQQMELIQKVRNGRSNRFKIVEYGVDGWAKLPAKGMYSRDNTIKAFKNFKLRTKNELNALKLLLVIAAFRDNYTNHAVMGFERFQHYTGVPRNEIRSALSLLVNCGLLHIDTGKSPINEESVTNLYRLAQLEPYIHRGSVDPGAIASQIAKAV